MSHRQTLKVASAQYPIDQPATLDAWRDKIARWVADGASTGAEILVFPEYAAIEQAAALGERVYSDLDATLQAVAELEVERVGLHQELAARHRVHILVGSGPARKGEGRYVNAAQLVTPKGSVGVQEKLIMTPFEPEWGISAGTPARVFDTALGLIGVAICYDSEFPLLVRRLVEAGAEIICVPSCTDSAHGYHRVRVACQARALENQCYVVQAPTVGDAPWSIALDVNVGAGGVSAPPDRGFPDDGVVALGPYSRPGWTFAELDLDAIARVRETGAVFNHRDWDRQLR